MYKKTKEGEGAPDRAERVDLERSSSGSRGGPRPTMIWLPLEKKVADAADSATLAVHDGSPPGIAAPRYRFALCLAFPLYPVNYVRHQLLLLFSLLLPIRTLADVGGLAGLFVARLLAILVVLVVGVTGTQVTDVAFAGFEVRVTAVALEERRRLSHLSRHVELVLVSVPTGSRW